MRIDYEWSGGAPRQHLEVGTGPIRLEAVLTTRQPYEPMGLEFKTDYYTPARFIRGSPDTRELGVIFTRLEMTPLRESSPAE